MMRVLLVFLLGCATTKPAEVVVLPASPPPGPWLALRDALATCAQRHGLVGEIAVRIEFDPDGGPGSVKSPYDAFSSCVGRLIVHWRYPAYANRAMYIPFVGA